MATGTTKTSTVKTKAEKTSAPKVARARKSAPAAETATENTAESGAETAADRGTDISQMSLAADVASSAMTPSHEVIAARAYERFCARGQQHGHHLEDWLAAENDLRRD